MHESLQIAVFDNLFASVCEQMGESLRRTSRSVNIKDRLDFSAALFDAGGELVAQAAHIPVHIGSMAFALRSILDQVRPGPGEMLITNDPYRGGTHLPDVTVVAPVVDRGRVIAWLANRAHHADVGGGRSGSMAPARTLDEEGVVIPPVVFYRRGRLLEGPLAGLFSRVADPGERRGDLMAQVAANLTGQRALIGVLARAGRDRALGMMPVLQAYARRAMESLIETMPPGEHRFRDVLDDDGMGTGPIPIVISVSRRGCRVRIDFTGTHPSVPGNVNAVLPVTMAAVFYVFRCLLGEDIPSNSGCLAPLDVVTPPDSLVDARPPRAVAAGNVETSQRIVDVLLGALSPVWPDRIPAASAGTMNNLSFRHPRFAYYETIAGGMGAGPGGPGASAVQTHMTNTLNTPVESLETEYPLRVREYRVRAGSGGSGRHRGGDGVIREIEALEPFQASILAERRLHPPWGLAGGGPGALGRQVVIRKNRARSIPAKSEVTLLAGDRIRIETPGGGGWGVGAGSAPGPGTGARAPALPGPHR